MASEHEHFAKMTMSPMLHRTTTESDMQEMIRGRLLDEFRQVVYNKMTVHTQRNHSDDTISAVAGIVIMTTDEYRAMQRTYAMNAVMAPMRQAPLVMKEVEQKAKEILVEEIKKSKSTEDYLTNRVRQLQNEHLLPKRRPT